MKSRLRFSLLWIVVLCPLVAARPEPKPFEVKLDCEVPELQAWGEKAQKLMIEWQPRIANMLGSKGFVPAEKTELKIHKTDQGIAFTARGRIQVSSHWIEKHPDDIGLVVHELAHVVQAYPGNGPGWVTEGVADYVRWAIYEGKPLYWFPLDKKPRGYRSSYQVTAGFLLWLETDRAPGIVNKLNASMRNRSYDEGLFKNETGKTLDELWDLYVKARTDSSSKEG